MKPLLFAAALAAVTAASPAAAVLTTFATFSPLGGTNVRFVNSGTSAGRTTDAVYYTTTTPTSSVAGRVDVNFNFINTVLAPFVDNVTASYRLDAVVAKNSPVLTLGTTYIQPGLSGTFSFLSTSAITVTGPGFVTTTYAAGSNLLSGTFTGGSLVASRLGTSGATFASGTIGTNISFTSDFLSFSALSELDRATSLTAISPASFPAANGALRSFRAVTNGQFSADPKPTALAATVVPEPATWALLMIGFGMVGAAARSRSRNASVAA